MPMDRPIKFEGPIPGENYTADTKNYPWHRPPEFADLDKAIEMSAKRLTEENNAISILTMIEAGVSVASITEMYLMSGIGAGKWTVDQALLLAGPVSHIICLMCKGYGVKYDLGVDNKKTPITSVFMKEMKKINAPKAKKAGQEVAKQVEDVKEKASGFMASAPKTNEVEY